MKINHITADNFLKLNLFDVDLSENTVHLFAGHNEAGKSSVQEAVRFALLGETVRVSTKGDYKLMIRDGAKSGTVSVDIDGFKIVRDIKTAKEQTEDTTVNFPSYLPYLLNAQQFASQKQDKRRSFLIELTGTKVKADDIKRRMLAKGVNEQCIEQVLPMLRSGFTATHKEAQTRAADTRSRWTEVTGQQRYGSQIAATWKPELPEDFDHATYLEKEKELEQIRASINQMNIKKGGIIAKIQNDKTVLSESGDKKPFKQADLTRVNKKIEEGESSLHQQESIHKDLNAQYFNGKEKSPVTCCECGSLLKVEFINEPGKGRVAVCEPYTPMSDAELTKIQSDIFTVGENKSQMMAELTELRTERTGLEDAKQAKKNKSDGVTQEDIDKLEADLGDINDAIDAKNSESGDLGDVVSNMRTIANKITDAEKTTRRAQELHESVESWTKCVETLAPDGIPAEILSDTLKPVNDRLRNTSNITGWAQVAIDPTMEIIVDGRRYSLLSESAQWRADVSIADAIANVSGLGLMIIDRMDVLDITSRGKFMQWINLIQADYDTVLIFGTLKSAPDKLPVGMKSYWIENGEVEL